MADRRLIDYLPPVVSDTKEMQAIMNTEQPEINRIWNNAENVLNDFFVTDATENGVKRWEKILRLSPKATESLETRKLRILAKMNEFLPYTFRTMLQMLNGLFNGSDYSVELEHALYKLQVILPDATFSDMEVLFDFFKRVVPANLTIGVASKIAIPASHLYVGNIVHIGGRQIIKTAIKRRTATNNVYSGAAIQSLGKTLLKTALTHDQEKWYLVM